MSKHAFIETELGLLPNDWQIVKLGEIGPFYKGAGISREDSHSGSIPAVRYGEIYTTHDNYIFKCTSFISPLIAKQSRRIHKGYILFTGSGETKEDIGKAVAFIDDYEAYAGGDIIILSPKKAYDPLYLGFFLNSSPVIRQRASLAQGDSVVHITAEALKEIRLALPPTKEEQSRIASALFDIDTLIRDLDRTIEKKQNIRQGAMEQLLSGKKRLPGFKGEWMTIHFEDIYKFAKEGGTPSTSVPEYYYPGTIPFAKIENLYDHYLTKTGSFISEEGLNHSSAWIVPSGNLLLSNGATLGEVTITAIPAATKQGILGLIIDQTNYSTEYLYYVLKMKDFKRKMEAITTHGTMDCAYLKNLKGIELFVASDIKEQRAIADLLTAMDDEIAMLQLERTKYANIRSGMMDDLLSGTKRL